MTTTSSRQARMTARLAFRLLRPLLSDLADTDITPRGLRRLAGVERAAALAPLPRGVRRRRVRFNGFHGEWVSAPGVPGGGRTVLYFHGGGFVFCGLATHRRLIAHLSAAAHAPVLSVAYRQLPEVPLSGSVADGVTAYRQLLSHGYDPAKVVLAGDSSGGLLAFATALQLAREGLPKPAAVVGFSPWLDLDCTARQAHPNADLDPLILVRQQARIAELLMEGVLPADPQASPLTGEDLSLLPPALIQVGSAEVLRCDAELMAERMEQAGVPCELQVWEGQIHVFQAFSAFIPEARLAIRQAGAFIREMTAEISCRTGFDASRPG